MSEHDGHLPSDVAALRKLPGVGPYSAGAVASIAFGKRETLVDGNVLRVMARILAIPDDIRQTETLRKIQRILETLIPEERPGDFNQALMEIGAIRCLPGGKPLCGACPFEQICAASLRGLTDHIPFKSPAARREIREYTVLVLEAQGRIALEKRPQEGLLASLWGFPMAEGRLAAEEVRKLLEREGYQVLDVTDLGPRKHTYTHLEWLMQGYQVRVAVPLEAENRIWAVPEQIHEEHALPKAFSMYFTGVRPQEPESPASSG